MAKNEGKVVSRVREAIEATVTELGFSIWDIEYKKIGADWHLTITIDSEEGVGIDECETVHRAIDPLLDEADPIEEAYYLDVSSPGLERDIRTKEHFLFCQGETVKIKLFAPQNKRREFVGTLSCNDDASIITVTENTQTFSFAFADIAKANVYCEI